MAEHPAGNRVERITVRTLALVTLLAATPGIAASQEVTAPSRAQDVAAVFSKHKHVVKEKRGVRREQYVDVRSEPFVAHTIAEYSGVYQVVGLGDVIHLQIGSDGTIQAAGHDSEPSRSFVLENARIEGAVLTATKAYRDGAAELWGTVHCSQQPPRCGALFMPLPAGPRPRLAPAGNARAA